MYSEEWPNAYYETANIGSDEAAVSYYPDYNKTLKIYTCPSTKNVIRPEVRDRNGIILDLRTHCRGDRESIAIKNGTSYEFFGWFQQSPPHGGPLPPGGIRKSPKTVAFGPHRVVLVLDADEPLPAPYPVSTTLNRNNRPDAFNNHGKRGWNWGFADGHAEWITAEKTYYSLTNGFMTAGTEYPPGP